VQEATVTKSRVSRLSALLALVLGATLSQAQVNVATWHNDNGRTGENTHETVLTRALVSNKNSFGRLCSAALDGTVRAQPLVMKVTIRGTTYTAVFVTTQNDSIYAFDGLTVTAGKPCTQLGFRHLLPSGWSTSDGGILGTPVIDTVTKIMYLVAGSAQKGGGAAVHSLYALDITSSTLTDKVAPVQIKGGTFIPGNSVQRAGLLGLRSSPGGAFGTVYVAFGRRQGALDVGPNHNGWIFSYDAATLKQKAFYCTTCGSATSNGGGVWLGGGALAEGLDRLQGTDSLYFSTGDGNFDLNVGGQNAGDSFIKMSTDLSTLEDYFSPFDQGCRNCPQKCPETDVDFGSGGVTIIPDNLLSNYPYIAVMADKTGYIWVIDRATPGGYGGSATGLCPSVVCRGSNTNIESIKASNGEFRVTGTYWNQSLYYAAENDALKRYPLANSACLLGNPPLCSSQAATTATFVNGVNPSVSSNGVNDGIVWALAGDGKLGSTTPGILYAFRADTLGELYDSSQCKVAAVFQDQPGDGTTFATPTVANGRVYIGTEGGTNGFHGGFHIYGPVTRTCD
jgi:hypothetical protein